MDRIRLLVRILRSIKITTWVCTRFVFKTCLLCCLVWTIITMLDTSVYLLCYSYIQHIQHIQITYRLPTSRNPIYSRTELLVSRYARSKGSIVGFSRYYRWCLTTHTRTSYVTATLNITGMMESEDMERKNVRPSKIKRGETNFQRQVTAKINVFQVTAQHILFGQLLVLSEDNKCEQNRLKSIF